MKSALPCRSDGRESRVSCFDISRVRVSNAPRSAIIRLPEVSQAVAADWRWRSACRRDGGSWRKVRAPQDRVVGNAHRPRGQGQCHRKQTAKRRRCPASSLADSDGAARVKRCGKSAPADRVTGLARQTPPGARPSREQGERGGLRPEAFAAARSVPDDSRVGCPRRRAIVVPEEWPLTTEPGLSAHFGVLS